MKRPTKYALLTIVAVAIAGCETQREARYADPGEIVSGTPDKPTMYDLESSADALMQKMLAHPQFSANYNAAKIAKGGKLPCVEIGNIENKTTERIQGRLDAVGNTVRSALFTSGLFEVKDEEAARAIKSRILRGADGGLEDGSLLMGTHESPDFIVLGDFRHFEDFGGIHTFRLRLAIHNLKTGKIVSEGVQTKVKL